MEGSEQKKAGSNGDSNPLSIGERVAALRKEHRYSIRKLAGEAGVSASLISDVERGRSSPRSRP